MPKGIPLTQVDIQQRREEIARAAIALFLDKGFNETGMREIAQAAGIGKSTLYDYFPAKDAIILFVVENNLNILLDRAREIIATSESVTDRLIHIMYMHLDFLLENRAFYLKLLLEAQRLKTESQQQIQTFRYAYQDLLKSLIEEGITDGSFRPVNATMAMKTLMSIMTPVVFTSRPYGTPQEMLDDSLDLFFKGIQA